MAKKTIYPRRREILFTKEQSLEGEKLAWRQQITFNQLIRNLLDNAVKIDGITRNMK